MLFEVGHGTAHPLLPDGFPTIVDTWQRFLQLVLFTRMINYAAEILAHSHGVLVPLSALQAQ